MEKEFVPYNPSLRLKAIDFNEPCFGYYNESTLSIEFIRNGNIFKETEDSIYFKENTSCLAPTFSQAFRWFRDEYKLFSSIEYSTTTQTDFVITINKKAINDARDEEYKTYEEAELACLTKLIEIVENNLVD